MSEETTPKTYADFALPPSVISKVDVSRMVREAEWADNERTTAEVRAKTGASEAAVPAVSGTFADFLEQNGLEFGDSHQRSELIKQLNLLKDRVPTIHMTFATTADRESLQQLAVWLRQSIHPQAVIDVGLQPALVAGVYLRTANKVLDFSVRGLLEARRDVLVTELEALRGTN